MTSPQYSEGEETFHLSMLAAPSNTTLSLLTLPTDTPAHFVKYPS